MVSYREIVETVLNHELMKSEFAVVQIVRAYLSVDAMSNEVHETKIGEKIASCA
jgi:hypothetical protein